MTQKLWQQNHDYDQTIEEFLTGDDLILDQKIVLYDVLGSLAHAQALHQLGIITTAELMHVQTALQDIILADKAGKFILTLGDEDVHTKIELYLTKKVGEVGQKIHTGRSRNDQVLTALRLYQKSELLEIGCQLQKLAETFLRAAKKYQNVALPGYTHTQRAMPSSVGLWFASYADSLIDDISLLQSVLQIFDQCPLGSAAGYGVDLDIDRELEAQILGFKTVQLTAPYAQLSRGKFEIQMINCLLNCVLDINAFASDVIFFTSQECAYFSVSSQLTTGSSVMPHKKNQDVAELLRSQLSLMLGRYTQLVGLKSNVISGYHRDYQQTKKPVMDAFSVTHQILTITELLVTGLTPNAERIKSALTADMFSVNAALLAVSKGVPFRDAYHHWQHYLDEYSASHDYTSVKNSRSLGSAGNLPLRELQHKLKKIGKTIHQQNQEFKQRVEVLSTSKGVV